MKIRFVADSSANIYPGSVPEVYASPMKIVTTEKEYVDDDHLDVPEMLKELRQYKGKSSTACPSVEDWLDTFGDADIVYGVSITSNLSGCYNAAMIAAQQYMEQHPDRKVFILDTLSTGPEMQLLLEKYASLVESGKSFDEVVSEIKEKFQNAQSVVVVHFSGNTVEEVTKLRNQCREAGVEYCVLKNKLVERALNELNIEGLNDQLTGPNAYAFGMTDAVAPAKVIYDFINKNKKEKDNLAVKAGLMGTELMDEAAVKALSEVPSRDVLLARLVGSIHAPVSNLVYALEAIRKQKAGEDTAE